MSKKNGLSRKNRRPVTRVAPGKARGIVRMKAWTKLRNDLRLARESAEDDDATYEQGDRPWHESEDAMFAALDALHEERLARQARVKKAEIDLNAFLACDADADNGTANDNADVVIRKSDVLPLASAERVGLRRAAKLEFGWNTKRDDVYCWGSGRSWKRYRHAQHFRLAPRRHRNKYDSAAA